MTVVKINALEIPPGAGDEIVKRFAARMNALADTPGFLGFELLRPTGEAETRWFVYTRWADDDAFEAWRSGDGARNAHAQDPSGDQQQSGGQQSGGHESGRAPVSMGATLLEFAVEVSAGPSGV